MSTHLPVDLCPSRVIKLFIYMFSFETKILTLRLYCIICYCLVFLCFALKEAGNVSKTIERLARDVHPRLAIEMVRGDSEICATVG